MGIQTTLIETLLYFNIVVTALLLQPYMQSMKESIVRFYFRTTGFSALCHILYALYCMVLLIFLDSLYKSCTVTSQILQYQSQRNYYLSGFTLFLALTFNKLCSILQLAYKTEKTNIENKKQHGNSMTFVNNVINEVKEEKAKNLQLEEKIEKLQNKIQENKEIMSEIENNKKAYLQLKDKYEKLKSEKSGETRKNK
jgi:B-cell receptor-associated protein 31